MEVGTAGSITRITNEKTNAYLLIPLLDTPKKSACGITELTVRGDPVAAPLSSV